LGQTDKFKVLSPLASSMFAPGINKIASALHTTESAVIACQTGYVITLGVGPLILAPLSETFGRKKLYIVCFGIFALLQIPTALSPNIETLITLRTVTGFFGSVGIANGGGTISDMYVPSERAGIFGWYLLGPLLGPTVGPLLGGIIMENLNWPWVFWVLTIICSVNVTFAFFFLKETYVPVLLDNRKKELENSHGGSYYYEGEDDRPLALKLRHSFQRPIKILFTQPIVMVMASYQALIFATTYSLYTQMQSIYGDGKDGYGFTTQQVGLLYLGPGLGFLFSVLFIVPRIDTVFNYLTEKNDGKSKPEFRLPLANIGSILIPISLFWFAWTVQYKVHWFVTILSTFFYGIGQVVIFNSTQNYYIDAFEKYAASAIAAGALFRSIIGGVVPLFTPAIFDKFGVGWGMSIFAFVSVLLAPSPLLFFYFGEGLRERFAIDL
jgi:multidrug resistance protein